MLFLAYDARYAKYGEAVNAFLRDYYSQGNFTKILVIRFF